MPTHDERKTFLQDGFVIIDRLLSPEETDWHRIADLYGALARIAPSPVVELDREARRTSADRPADGPGAHHAADHRRPLPYAHVGDTLHVREVLVTRRKVRDHIRQGGYAEVPEGGLYPGAHAGQLGDRSRAEIGEGRPLERLGIQLRCGGASFRLHDRSLLRSDRR
jgi:hypothetical protein